MQRQYQNLPALHFSIACMMHNKFNWGKKVKKYTYLLQIIFLVAILLQPNYSQTFFTRETNTGSLNSSGGGISSAWGDVNNDGYPDLVKISGGRVSLHINDGDGTFTQVSSGHLVTNQFYQNSIVFGDYDNDGNLDLYLSNLGPDTPIQPGQPLKPQINYLYRNTGAPNYEYELVTDNGLDTDSNMTWTSSWVDYNNDGYLDMFVPGDQGDKDLFFQNNGDGTFTKITGLSFLNPGEFSAAGSWTDFDNDGDQDLLVVNYQGKNNELYKNELNETGSANFTQITQQPIVTDRDYDLAPSFGDYDNDGDMDVFIGTWIGNSNLLFTNEGNFEFDKVTGEPIVERTWTLAYTWLDYDNDGYLDCFVANSQGEANTLYQNNGDGSFTKITQSQAGDILTSWGFTSGASVADYDNDGDIDIYVPGSNASLFKNEIGSQNNWLQVACEGMESNKQAIGVKSRAKAKISDGNSVWQLREIHGGATGDRAQNHQRVHFGLGSAQVIDSLIVEWPSGIVDIYTDVVINQFLKVVEGESPTSVEHEGSLITEFRLYQNYPNPFNPSTTISFGINTSGPVAIRIYNNLGEEIRTLVEQNYTSGQHDFTWDGKNEFGSVVPSGAYYARITKGRSTKTIKMLLLK